MKITLPPCPESLEALRQFLDQALDGVLEADRISLAIQEAATNYMKYADRAAAGCPLEVSVEIEDGWLTARIPSFCPQGTEGCIQPRPLDAIRPGGLGTHFINEIMDEVKYDDEGEGHMTLVLTRMVRRQGDINDV